MNVMFSKEKKFENSLDLKKVVAMYGAEESVSGRRRSTGWSLVVIEVKVSRRSSTNAGPSRLHTLSLSSGCFVITASKHP